MKSFVCMLSKGGEMQLVPICLQEQLIDIRKMEIHPRQSVKQRRQWHPTPVLLPGKSRGWRSLVGCSPWGCEESDMTERLPFHFSLSCIGEGKGNPLQCSCLENPRDRGAWWAAVYGVAQSWTRLKRLSSSSSSQLNIWIIFNYLIKKIMSKRSQWSIFPPTDLRILVSYYFIRYIH